MRLLLLLLLLTPVLRAQPAADRAATLDAALAALHAEGLFDGALAIAEDGAVVYRAAFGTHDGRPLTTRTPLALASVEKMITAAAVLDLAVDGLVTLDAPVADYLNAWPYPDVTVRHLLTQTSGLHFLTALNAASTQVDTLTSADVLALIAADPPGLAFEPGRAFDYDNANYVALTALVAAVAARPYGEVVRDRVAAPAGMDSARVASAGGGRLMEGETAYASAEDLLAFDRAFATGRIVPLPLVRAAETPPVLADGSPSRYGYGRFLTDDPRPLVGHFGDGAAAKTGLWRERETGTTYAIVMPGDAVHRTAILTAAMAIWNGEPYTLPEARPVADVPEAVLARHVGVYASGMGRLHITLEDGQLHLEPEGAGGSEPLIPASETVFYFGHQDLTWEFVVDASGATTGLMLQGNPETLGQKVE